MLIFYGTEESLSEWAEIVERETDKVCGEIQEMEDRYCFHVDLSLDDRMFLHTNFWTKEHWNTKITYHEPITC